MIVLDDAPVLELLEQVMDALPCDWVDCPEPAAGASPCPSCPEVSLICEPHHGVVLGWQARGVAVSCANDQCDRVQPVPLPWEPLR